ncbi:NUDIX domain-containing protein [uncultured Jatrophihabitans sp.]|uniref:NUDIX hydrolase n=1 Tax=uncultured Jatrophihabitans sp. TaxID=1610747 RepID=UPI0035CA7DC3
MSGIGDPHRGDGNGWVWCAQGHRHWGRFGAAGLLLTDGARVLLQHRAAWTHEGDTWAVPGGARDSDETPVDAALREATEETSLDPSGVELDAEWVDDHGGWAYTTVLACTRTPVEVTPVNAESTAVRWWPLDEVDTLRLHSGFARAWPALRALIG